MRKILICLLSFAPFAAFGATEYLTGRAGIMANRVGAAVPVGRPTVPVITTTTTNVHVPETNITTEESNTVNLDIDGARASCLATLGNVWANNIYASPQGTPTTYMMDVAPDAANNTCYSTVSVKSAEIKNMGRFFPPRYFKTGTSIECGSWLDQNALDDAILDSKKTARTWGTIAGVVGGAAIGVTLTEVIGRNFIKGFEGQLDLEGEELLRSQLLEMKKENPSAFAKYAADMADLKKICDEDSAFADRAADDIKEKCGTANATDRIIKQTGGVAANANANGNSGNNG